VLSSLRQDVAYALRAFGRIPGLTAAIVVSIGLGIAANTTVFSMINALLLRDLPIREPNGVLAIATEGGTFSLPDYLAFRDQSKSVFEGLAAHFPFAPANLNAGGTPQRVWGQLVSGNYFSVFGIQPYLGRGILPFEDEVKGRNPVVVLGYGLWRRLGGNPAVVGKTVVMSGAPYTVVGVAPPGFVGTDRILASDFWAPLAMRGHLAREIVREGDMSRNAHWLEVAGRLRPGVTREQAVAVLNVINARIYAEHEKNRKTPPVKVYRVGHIPEVQNIITLLMTALMVVVGLVLLIACANVANLLLARAASRQQEIGIRLAVGASRGRLVRQLLTESVLLSAGGAVFGYLLAIPGIAALGRFQPPLPLPIVFDVSPDWRVLVFTTVLAVFTGILFGLAPALTGTRGSLTGAIRQTGWGGRGVRRGRMAGVLVAVQVTFSLVLLIGSGLFLRSLQKASSIDIGMKPEGVLLLSVDPKTQGYDQERTLQFYRQLDERVTALPGVQSMSYVDILPLSLAANGDNWRDADHKDGKQAGANRFAVGPHYFETMGIGMVRGRDFSPQRDYKAAVVVINEALAKRVFGNEDPLGRHVQRGDAKDQIFEVIGVVRNAKAETLGEAERACVFNFLPSNFDDALTFFGTTMMVRTHGDAARMTRAIQEQVQALDRDMPVFAVETMTHHIEEAMMIPRLCAGLFGLFGAIGLVLAVVGLYGVVNYSVRTRTREIGIRVALGARASSVAGMVARQGLRLVAIGIALGLGISFLLSQAVASLLWGISATDALTFVGVPAVLLMAALIAVLLPARRASRIEPMAALRYE
jgi:predicted permease